MKVLMTSETYLPAIGGAEVHIYNLKKKLRDSGVAISFFTNQEYPLETDPEIVRIKWSRKNLFKILTSLWRQSQGCQLIHAHYCHRLAFFVGLIGFLRRIPVIITLHGMGILDPAGASFLNRLKHSFYRYFSLKLCTYVISTSQDLADVAYRYIPREKIGIILNGYDDALFSRDKNTVSEGYGSKKVVMTVRRLVPKNGVQYLIEAAPLILKNCPSMHFVLVGDGPLREHIEKRISELGIRDNVTLLGRVDNEKVIEHLRYAHVVAFPSTAESSSIACAEAMGMGKTVVASRVGGLIELLGEHDDRGILVDMVPWTGSNYDAPVTLPQSSYQALADAVTRALSEDGAVAEKRKAAYEYAIKNLTWEAITKKTAAVYGQVVNVKI